MSWLRRLLAGGTPAEVGRARQAQEQRKNATRRENLEPVVGGAIVSLPIPYGWQRIDHDRESRRQFLPPEVVGIGGMNSAEINVLVAHPTGPAPVGPLDNLPQVLGQSYSAFSLLETRPADVEGATSSQFVKFRYRASQVVFIDSQTHALHPHKWLCIVICSAAEEYRDIYEAVFEKVHRGMVVR